MLTIGLLPQLFESKLYLPICIIHLHGNFDKNPYIFIFKDKVQDELSIGKSYNVNRTLLK